MELDGISDIEGKAAMGSGERAGRRASFNCSATMDEPQPRGKILLGTEGLGTVTAQMVEERAREIARSDGREEPNDLDRSRARAELTSDTSSGSEKPPMREEPGRDWEMPLVSSGEKAPTVRPEDEENIPQKLIQEGLDEADHDQRSRSAQTRNEWE